MEGKVISSPLCSFCYRSTANFDSDGNVDEEEEEKDKSLVPNFIQLTETYFGKGLSHGDVSKLKLRSCEDCRFVIESFSTMCKKLISLEKKVKERMLLLKNVMSSADKVKSRVKAYGNYSKRERGGEMIQEFRKDFIEKCSEHFSKPPQTPPEVTKLTKKKEAQVAPPPPLTTVMSNILKDVPRSEQTSIFHSLVSSFIVLLLGMSETVQNGSTSVLPELDDLSNDLDDCLITCTGPKLEPACPPLIINLDKDEDDGNTSDNQTVVIHQSDQSESSRTKKTDYKVMLKPLTLDKGAAKKRKVEILSDSSTDYSDSSSSEEEPERDGDDPDFETTSVSHKTQFQCCSCKKPFKEKKSLENHQRTCGSGSASSSRGRPSKRGRRSIGADYEATILRGSGTGTSPWQVNLMRVIGALHK